MSRLFLLTDGVEAGLWDMANLDKRFSYQRSAIIELSSA